MRMPRAVAIRTLPIPSLRFRSRASSSAPGTHAHAARGRARCRIGDIQKFRRWTIWVPRGLASMAVPSGKRVVEARPAPRMHVPRQLFSRRTTSGSPHGATTHRMWPSPAYARCIDAKRTHRIGHRLQAVAAGFQSPLTTREHVYIIRKSVVPDRLAWQDLRHRLARSLRCAVSVRSEDHARGRVDRPLRAPTVCK